MEYQLMLKPMRRAKGMTQAQFAKLIDVSERKLASWERGETNILLEDAFRCAIVLGCDVNDLCGWPKGKNEGRSFDDGYENELISRYRECTPEWQDNILKTARASAVMSKEVSKCDSSADNSEARKAM